MLDHWRELYQPIEDLLIKVASGTGDRDTARAWVEHVVNLKDLQGTPFHDNVHFFGYGDTIEKYRVGMDSNEVAQRLSNASTVEKIIAYGTRRVGRKLAKQRLQNASTIERGLIFAYFPDLVQS